VWNDRRAGRNNQRACGKETPLMLSVSRVRFPTPFLD